MLNEMMRRVKRLKEENGEQVTREELEATAGQIMASVDGKVDGVNLSAKNVMTVDGRYKGVNAHIFDPYFDSLGNKDKIIIVTRPQHVGADGNVVVDRTAWLNVFGFEGANANRAGLLRGDEWSFLKGLMDNGVATAEEIETLINNIYG